MRSGSIRCASMSGSSHSIDSLLGSFDSGVSGCIQEEDDPVDRLCMEYCGRFVDLSNLVNDTRQQQGKPKERQSQQLYPSTVSILSIMDLDSQNLLSKARRASPGGTVRSVSRQNSTDSTRGINKIMSASSHMDQKRRVGRHNSGVGAVRMTYDGTEEHIRSLFPSKLLGPGGKDGKNGPLKRGVGRSRSAMPTFMQIDPAKTVSSKRGVGRSNSSDNPTGISAPPLVVTSDYASHSGARQQPYFRYPTIEITPGVYERLRGSEETLRAIESGHVTICDCLVCNSCLVTIGDAEFVLCPDCKVVSPIVLSDNDSSHEHTKRHYGREMEEPAVRGGVGLGVHVSSCGMVVDDDVDQLDECVSEAPRSHCLLQNPGCH